MVMYGIKLPSLACIFFGRFVQYHGPVMYSVAVSVDEAH
jgi:hypothetical protein